MVLDQVIIPEDYVPDDGVVFLKQKVEYEPIYYNPEMAYPYEWQAFPEVNLEKLMFLEIRSFASLLKPDFKADTVLYAEVKAHHLAVKDDKQFLALKDLLLNYEFVMPLTKEFKKGKKIRDYSNAFEYEYPDIKGAKISLFHNGDYKITLPDGSNYYHKVLGNYWEEDSDGTEKYAVFPSEDMYRIIEGSVTYSKLRNGIAIEMERDNVKVTCINAPEPQYQFEKKVKNVKCEYTFFITDSGQICEIAFTNGAGIRFDYFTDDEVVLVAHGNEAIQLTKEYKKYHTYFNKKTRKAEGLISLYLREGIRFRDLDGPITYAELIPQWPENYEKVKKGAFSILYTRKDKDFLKKIDMKKLNDVASLAKKITGVKPKPFRTIILPPDLESYCKLHTGIEPETMYWYPSGFQTKDTIVMWPPSVPRYTLKEGQDYFWDKEFYEILIHELTHLIIGEVTGIFSAVPVWLNEGCALYVESTYAEETKHYWNTTFKVSYQLSRLLDWDEVTLYSTSCFPVTIARIHYAQSYAMVAYLVEQYGNKKVMKYVQSFRVPYEDCEKEDLAIIYKENFFKVFGMTWDEHINLFYEYIKTEGEIKGGEK